MKINYQNKDGKRSTVVILDDLYKLLCTSVGDYPQGKRVTETLDACITSAITASKVCDHTFTRLLTEEIFQSISSNVENLKRDLHASRIEVANYEFQLEQEVDG